MSIFFNVVLCSFVVAMCLATFVYSEDPESAEGWGLAWFFSIPFFALGSLASSLAHSWYVEASSLLVAALRYSAIALLVFLCAPIGFFVLQRLW